VQADLCKSGDPTEDADDREVLPYLEGDRIVAFKDGFHAVFKKLKITGTSTQIGGHPFQIRFQLMREISSNGALRMVPVDGLVLWSVPIMVFSHTTYLKSNKPVVVPKKATTSEKKTQRKRTRLEGSDDDDDDDEGDEVVYDEEDDDFMM
jgi:hypothetical protein